MAWVSDKVKTKKETWVSFECLPDVLPLHRWLTMFLDPFCAHRVVSVFTELLQSGTCCPYTPPKLTRHSISSPKTWVSFCEHGSTFIWSYALIVRVRVVLRRTVVGTGSSGWRFDNLSIIRVKGTFSSSSSPPQALQKNSHPSDPFLCIRCQQIQLVLVFRW